MRWLRGEKLASMNISSHSNACALEDVENQRKSYRVPSRWWLASTAFPLIAGILGPMASAFTVCALVQDWRVAVTLEGKETSGDSLADPEWLLCPDCRTLMCQPTNLSNSG